MLSWLHRIFVYLIVLGLPVCLSAQEKSEFRLENITSEYIRIEQGLSQNTVNCILQDHRGFLWIGTWSGLNRFDGYSFKTITRDFFDPSSGLTNPEVVGLIEDSLGFIWVATSKGLNKINPLTFTTEQFTTDNSLHKGFSCDTLLSIFQDSYGYIWLGTTNGAFQFNPKTEQFIHFQHNPRDTRTISDRFVTVFEEDSDRNIWIGTRDGLNYLIRKTGQIIRYYARPGPGHLSSSSITDLTFCKEGYLWIGTNNGLIRLDPYTNWFEPYFLLSEELTDYLASPNYITSLYNDNNNDLWVGTQEFGLYIFNKSTKQFNNLANFIEDASIFHSNTIGDIIEDSNGLIWIGISHRGLAKLIPEPHSFKKYLRGFPTYGLTEYPKDFFWFGTQNGVHIFDKNLERVIRKIEHEFNNPLSLANNRVTNIVRDGADMWIATKSGLSKYNTNSEEIVNFYPDGTNNSIAGEEVWGILKASDGTFWFSTQSGLSNYNPVSARFKNYKHDPNNPNTISSDACFQVFELEPDIFLVSTQHGLNRFDAEQNSWEVFLPIPGNRYSISSEYIFGVMQDIQGEIWVYTNGGGFNRFDPVSISFEHFTTDDGLADNIVYGMIEDKDGFFWLSTNNGLSRFDPVDEIFIKFDVQDGLPSNEFNFNGTYQTSDGEIFMAGVNGITSFFPLSYEGFSKPPSVQFTELYVHDGGTLIEFPLDENIDLQYYQNSFHISFAALDYLNPFKNKFEYKLEKFDDTWTSLDMGVHQIEYRKLPPGDYKLHLIGSNSMGTSTKTFIDIRIHAAWWQTLIFKVFATSLSLFIIGFFILFRYNMLERKHSMEKQLLTIEKELVQSQKFALRSQMNPHFIFNSLNSIQNFVLKNDVDAANYYLSNFSMLMRRVLENSQHNMIVLDEEIQLIKLYIKMEKLRFSDKFDVEINIDPKIDIHLVRIPPMLLQPYMENAILHGLQLIKHKGLLKINFVDLGNAMDILIEDNGIGRTKANAIRKRQMHKSKGLKNIEKRIQLYNKINPRPIRVSITDLSDNQNEPCGTRVTLNLPYETDESEF